jgi:thymidylate kinase
VSEAYLKIAEEHPERFVVIHVGDADEDAVHRQVVGAIDRLLREREEDERDG